MVYVEWADTSVIETEWQKEIGGGGVRARQSGKTSSVSSHEDLEVAGASAPMEPLGKPSLELPRACSPPEPQKCVFVVEATCMGKPKDIRPGYVLGWIYCFIYLFIYFCLERLVGLKTMSNGCLHKVFLKFSSTSEEMAKGHDQKKKKIIILQTQFSDRPKYS